MHFFLFSLNLTNYVYFFRTKIFIFWTKGKTEKDMKKIMLKQGETELKRGDFA